MSTNPRHLDPITELRYALAQSDTANPAQAFREQLLQTAMVARRPGMPVDAEESISGLEAFRRLTSRLSRLLADLPLPAWAEPSIRDLDVQGLVGHLTGVELAFAACLQGDETGADADHVDSTQPSALRQRGRSPQETFDEWALATERTIALCEAAAEPADPARIIRFHGIELDLDAFLVVRSFEIWTHDEDIRRAVGRGELDPDPQVLTRMTGLATTLLPIGIAVAATGVQDAEASARLVLTGPGGGSWDVPLQGPGGPGGPGGPSGLGDRGVRRAMPGARIDGHIVVDSAAFCRVVANRADRERSGAIVSQGDGVADLLLRGAAALALD